MEEGDYVACPEPPKPFVNIVEDGFGFITKESGEREIVRRFTFTNQDQLSIQIMTYGASIISIKYPDKEGVIDDVVLGFDDLEGYLSPKNAYFGATIGRVANRIAKGHFRIGDLDFQLTTNLGQHHIHGGFKGFDKANWKSEIQGKKVVMTHMSKDGEEGYPGEVLTCILFEMTTDNDFLIEMKATSTKPTPVNLTNHSYFNLAGHSKGAVGLYQHIVAINADRFCHTDEDFIPTGMLKNVVNTLWDLRIGRKLATAIHHVPFGGYDQNMCIHKTGSECMSFVARVYHPETGRSLEVYSNQPGVQFYTSNNLPTKPSGIGNLEGIKVEVGTDGCLVRKCPLCGQLIKDADFEHPEDEYDEEGSQGDAEKDMSSRLIGKGGAEYFRHAAFSLMTQNYPDSVHRKNFPNSILKPGESYHHYIKYKFGVYIDAVPLIEEEEAIISDESSEGEGEFVPEPPKDEDDLLGTKLEENAR